MASEESRSSLSEDNVNLLTEVLGKKPETCSRRSRNAACGYLFHLVLIIIVIIVVFIVVGCCHSLGYLNRSLATLLVVGLLVLAVIMIVFLSLNHRCWFHKK